MFVEELENLFRTLVDDIEEPYLVSHESFLEYLNDAQEEACIRSRLIFDNFSSFCKIKTKNNVKKYNINERIYVVLNAFVNDGNEDVPLKITERLEMDRISSTWRTETGKPLYLIQYDNHIELSPVPDDQFNIKIECYLTPLELTNKSDSPEINKTNHRKLLHWVKHRYYDLQDNDIVEVRKSNSELIMFEKTFGVRPSANNMRSRYKNRPQFNKVHIA